MRKRILCLSMVAILLLSFAACSSGETVVGEQIVQEKGHYSFGYLSFTGTRNIHFDVTGEKSVNIAVLTMGGEVSVDIFYNPQEMKNAPTTSLYSGEKTPTGNWDIPLEKGSYILRVTGEKHSGSVGITYL